MNTNDYYIIIARFVNISKHFEINCDKYLKKKRENFPFLFIKFY